MEMSMDADFREMTEKAKQIAERRSVLNAQEEALSKQIDDVQVSLVKEYGEDYLEQYQNAVARIRKWDEFHAQS